MWNILHQGSASVILQTQNCQYIIIFMFETLNTSTDFCDWSVCPVIKESSDFDASQYDVAETMSVVFICMTLKFEQLHVSQFLVCLNQRVFHYSVSIFDVTFILL